VRNPLLTEISVDWGGLPVADTYPKRIPDLFSAKPVVLTGRYNSAGQGVIRLRGKMAGRAFERRIPITLSAAESGHEVLKTLWARTRVGDLMSQDWAGLQQGAARPEVQQEITQLGLDYRLMTQFTSFVAVEELIITDGGAPRRVEVPVEMPEGVSYEGVFGERFADKDANASLRQNGSFGGANKPMRAAAPVSVGQATRTEQSAGRELYRVDEAEEANLSPAERKRRLAKAKMHPSLQALAEHLAQGGSALTADDRRLLKDGKVEIQVWLEDASVEVRQALKALGFELIGEPRVAKILLGRIPAEKLGALAELPSVRYVGPLGP
jgi:Ca-activated chloride channel family protein